MSRSLIAIACLFWLLLLGMATFGWWRHGEFHRDLYYLLGIPVGMIAFTLLVSRLAILSRYRVVILAAASMLCLFAGAVWGGIWGGDV